MGIAFERYKKYQNKHARHGKLAIALHGTREGDRTNVTKLATITSMLKIANEVSENFSKLALQTSLIVSVTTDHG